MNFPTECSERVRRSTGRASTPFTQSTSVESCGRATTRVLTDESGEVWGWSCNRHKAKLTKLSEAVSVKMTIVEV